jgi:hypothetical protein
MQTRQEKSYDKPDNQSWNNTGRQSYHNNSAGYNNQRRYQNMNAAERSYNNYESYQNHQAPFGYNSNQPTQMAQIPQNQLQYQAPPQNQSQNHAPIQNQPQYHVPPQSQPPSPNQAQYQTPPQVQSDSKDQPHDAVLASLSDEQQQKLFKKLLGQMNQSQEQKDTSAEKPEAKAEPEPEQVPSQPCSPKTASNLNPSIGQSPTIAGAVMCQTSTQVEVQVQTQKNSSVEKATKDFGTQPIDFTVTSTCKSDTSDTTASKDSKRNRKTSQMRKTASAFIRNKSSRQIACSPRPSCSRPSSREARLQNSEIKRFDTIEESKEFDGQDTDYCGDTSESDVITHHVYKEKRNTDTKKATRKRGSFSQPKEYNWGYTSDSEPKSSPLIEKKKESKEVATDTCESYQTLEEKVSSLSESILTLTTTIQKLEEKLDKVTKVSEEEDKEAESSKKSKKKDASKPVLQELISTIQHMTTDLYLHEVRNDLYDKLVRPYSGKMASLLAQSINAQDDKQKATNISYLFRDFVKRTYVLPIEQACKKAQQSQLRLSKSKSPKRTNK